MPLEITYWTGTARSSGGNVAGQPMTSESRALSASSAQSGATPNGAVLVSILSTENARFEYSSANPTAAASSAYIGSGERLWMQAIPGFKIAALTA